MGNRGEVKLSRPAKAVPQKTAKVAQRAVTNFSAKLTNIFRLFPQL
jgi:hypothetical protein